MKPRSFVLLGLCAASWAAACTHPAEERALAELGVGHAEANDARVSVANGLAAIRAFGDRRLELWAGAPSIDVTLSVDAQSAGPWTAWLGQRGTSPAKREGDRRTPAGIFGFLRTMYGIEPSPGVRYSYRRLVCGDWWVEDPASPYYNRFRHVRCGSTPQRRTGSPR
jgi:hypothetical protein